jgi:hypothetical protein
MSLSVTAAPAGLKVGRVQVLVEARSEATLMAASTSPVAAMTGNSAAPCRRSSLAAKYIAFRSSRNSRLMYSKIDEASSPIFIGSRPTQLAMVLNRRNVWSAG